MTIHPIENDEVDAVLKVYQQCEDFLAFGPVPTASLDMVMKDLEMSHTSGGVFCGIYTADGDMIGIVDYVPSHFGGDPHTAFLSLVMIAASFRHRGIGHAVVEAIETAIMTNAQIHTIRSGVQVNNPHAVRFWQKQGYQIVSGPELLSDQTTVFGLRKAVNRRLLDDEMGTSST